MAVSRYVEMQHKFAAEVPPELQEHQERVLFVRWLVRDGRLSDWRSDRPDSGTPAAEVGELEGAGARS